MNKRLILVTLLIGFSVGVYVGRVEQRRADLQEYAANKQSVACQPVEIGPIIPLKTVRAGTIVTAATTVNTQVMTCSIIDLNKKK